MMEKDILQLMLTNGIGNISIKRVFDYMRLCQENSLTDICEDIEKLAVITKCPRSVVEKVRDNKEYASKLINQLDYHGISIILENNPLYPMQLKSVLGKQCPSVLFVKGNKELLSSQAVGFCGSRKVSPKGISITAQCAEQLVQHSITITSGYAAGTDISAHVSAMAHGGSTIFVLAEGILRYTEKQAIRGYLTSSNHVFVSQFLPQAAWNVGNAMKRNSVIIGLSKAMILVESGKTGGTFSAGEEALRRGVPLFVIDYAKPEVSAEANPYFIERGGYPIRGINTVPNLEKVFSVVNDSHKADSTADSTIEQLTIDIGSDNN